MGNCEQLPYNAASWRRRAWSGDGPEPGKANRICSGPIESALFRRLAPGVGPQQHTARGTAEAGRRTPIRSDLQSSS